MTNNNRSILISNSQLAICILLTDEELMLDSSRGLSAINELIMRETDIQQLGHLQDTLLTYVNSCDKHIDKLRKSQNETNK